MWSADFCQRIIAQKEADNSFRIRWFLYPGFQGQTDTALGSGDVFAKCPYFHSQEVCDGIIGLTFHQKPNREILGQVQFVPRKRYARLSFYFSNPLGFRKQRFFFDTG